MKNNNQLNNIVRSIDYRNILLEQEKRKQASVEEEHKTENAKQVEAEAFTKGFFAGEEKAKVEMAKELLIFNQQIEDNIFKIEDQICDLILQSIRKIMSDFDQLEVIQSLVSEGLKLLNESQVITICAHPDILVDLQKAKAIIWPNRIEFEKSQLFDQDEVEIRSSSGSVRLRVEEVLGLIESVYVK